MQYNFLSYVDVIQKGVPDEYRVLILPACLCMSDAEIRAIEAFCQRGGTVIADYLPGVWDQHGKGRASGGGLDALFGVKHDPKMRRADVFGGALWVEVDQDANYSWKTYREFLTNKNSCILDGSGFHKAVRSQPTGQIKEHGKGRAVLMNLSPQWYNAHREAGFDAAKKREVFMHHVADAGVTPWVRLADAGEREHGYEITYWKLPSGRTLLYLCLNPEIRGTSLGGGNSVGLKSSTLPAKLRINKPVQQMRNERSGQELGSGREFTLDWIQHEAAVFSFIEDSSS